MADWERALDKQLATYLWWHSEAALGPAQGWIEDVNRKYDVEDHESVDGFLREHRGLLWQADPIWVTPDMADLLEAAYPSFQPEPVSEEDLIVPAGFALLPRVFYIPDVWGKRTAVRAIAWKPTTISIRNGWNGVPGISVSLFCNPSDEDDYSANADFDWMRNLYGDAMALVSTTAYAYGEDFDKRIEWIIEHRQDKDKINIETARDSAFQEIRLVQTFWRMTRQQIAVGFRQRASRAQRRRSERAEYPDKYVTVVTLRRPRSAPGDEHHAVDWKMRWIVSGHWRWQPYKDGSRRQIWIAPFVKGPSDKPLSVRKLRVFQWSR